MIINIIFIYTLLNFLVLKFNKGIVMRKTKFIAICLSVCVANSLFGAEHKDNNETKLDGIVVSASEILKQNVSEGKFKEKLKAKVVFLSVGELEKRKGKTDKPGTLKASDLAQILKQSGVNFHFEFYKGQTHGSVIPLNLKELLKYLKD